MSPSTLRGRAAVAAEDAPDVVIRLARRVQPDRRQRHPFGERVGGERREPTGDGAAEIRHVHERAGEEARRPAEEDRPEDEHVVGVDAAEVRVVHREDVARLHGVQRRRRRATAGRLQRRLELCIRLVDVDCATSWPAGSSSAAQASAPSWMNVECDDRTTTRLASSTATSRPLRITSAVTGSAAIRRLSFAAWVVRSSVRRVASAVRTAASTGPAARISSLSTSTLIGTSPAFARERGQEALDVAVAVAGQQAGAHRLGKDLGAGRGRGVAELDRRDALGGDGRQLSLRHVAAEHVPVVDDELGVALSGFLDDADGHREVDVALPRGDFERDLEPALGAPLADAGHRLGQLRSRCSDRRPGLMMLTTRRPKRVATSKTSASSRDVCAAPIRGHAHQAIELRHHQPGGLEPGAARLRIGEALGAPLREVRRPDRQAPVATRDRRFDQRRRAAGCRPSRSPGSARRGSARSSSSWPFAAAVDGCATHAVRFSPSAPSRAWAAPVREARGARRATGDPSRDAGPGRRSRGRAAWASRSTTPAATRSSRRWTSTWCSSSASSTSPRSSSWRSPPASAR